MKTAINTKFYNNQLNNNYNNELVGEFDNKSRLFRNNSKAKLKNNN